MTCLWFPRNNFLLFWKISSIQDTITELICSLLLDWCKQKLLLILKNENNLHFDLLCPNVWNKLILYLLVGWEFYSILTLTIIIQIYSRSTQFSVIWNKLVEFSTFNLVQVNILNETFLDVSQNRNRGHKTNSIKTITYSIQPWVLHRCF